MPDGIAYGRTRPCPPSNYINNEKRGRVSPRTSKKLFLPVVLVVSNQNIQTFQHSNIYTVAEPSFTAKSAAGSVAVYGNAQTNQRTISAEPGLWSSAVGSSAPFPAKKEDLR